MSLLVPRFAAVSRHHVTSALEEIDTPRREEFVLMHSGEAYGAQAVLSAAHQKATGTAVTAYDWSSKDQAARILVRGPGSGSSRVTIPKRSSRSPESGARPARSGPT